ncbi:THO complex subunit 1 [Culicoides brevitarsis]|uniref:THO complex subunit 1 n=1 Tax=Culicoides brevitarsis TaxID=469753 RepID=UPI00307CBFFE
MGTKNYLDMRKYFLDQIQSQYTSNNVDNFKASFESCKGSDIDKKTAVDQSFRDILLDELVGDIQKIETLINFSVECGRKNYATATIPVVLLGDAFDIMTLDQCEEMFSYVEKNVSVWKEECFFSACKNNLLRMCNDLLRRLSRSQNTVFCGRILLFLAKFFPFSERSGLNIVSEFNLENVTEFGAESTEIGDQLSEADEKSGKAGVKIDYNLYCKFWALQDFFRNPNQCYDRLRWKTFETHSMHVLSAFSSCKLEETNTSKRKHSDDEEMCVDSIESVQQFFAKFLTNPKLLALQLSDSNFRRSVLVQFLILFQYLTSTVKFKQDSYVLTAQQNEWIKETDAQIYKLLNETPPNGKKFSETVRHMLMREEIWSSWKNEGCKEFKKPEQATDTKPQTGKKPRKLLGDLIRDYTNSGKVYMGNAELTRLWNLCPDNLSACKGSERDFLPTFEEFLEQKPKDKPDSSFDWRALRLLARQSPHFFTLNNQSAKVSDCLETVSKRIKKEKEERQTANPGTTTEDTQNGETNLTDNDHLAEEMEAELIKDDGDSQDGSNNVDQHEHKAAVVTPEILKQLSEKIGDEWKRLAAKLGLANDEIQFIETENPGIVDQCKHMLTVWFDDDEDASLDNLAYILEGLEMNAASECAKNFIGQEKVEEISD